MTDFLAELCFGYVQLETVEMSGTSRSSFIFYLSVH